MWNFSYFFIAKSMGLSRVLNLISLMQIVHILVTTIVIFQKWFSKQFCTIRKNLKVLFSGFFQIDLRENPLALVCDSHLCWAKPENTSGELQNIGTACTSPAELTSTMWTDITRDLLRCPTGAPDSGDKNIIF